RFEFWLKPVTLVSAGADRIVLFCGSSETRDRLVQRFGAKIAELFQLHTQLAIPIDFIGESTKPELAILEQKAEIDAGPALIGATPDLCPPLEPRSIVLDALVVVPREEAPQAPPPPLPLPASQRRVTVEDIKRHTAAFYGIKV